MNNELRSLAMNVASGKLTRRDAIRSAVALGAAAGLASTGIAAAQDASPAAAAPTAYEPKGPQVEKLLFWTRSSPDSSLNEWNALKAATDKYTELVGTPIEMTTVVDADFRTNLSLAAPNGDGPDVFGPIAHDWVGELALQEIIMPMDEAAVGMEDISDATKNSAVYNGKLYGYPVFSESLLMFRNTDIVADAPTTWDELVTMATDATDGDVWGFSFQILEPYYVGAFLHAAGGYIFKDNNGTLDTEDIGLNSEGGVMAAKWIRDMFNTQVPPMPQDIIDPANAAGFLDGIEEAGMLGMRINGPWREPALKDAGIPYAITKLPTAPNGEQLRPFSGIQVFGVNAFGKQQEAALDLVNFFGSVQGVGLMFEGFNKAPVHESMKEQAIATSPTLGAVMDQVVDAVPMPNIPQMASVWTPWQDALRGIVQDNVSDDEVQSLLDTAVEQIKTQIAQN